MKLPTRLVLPALILSALVSCQTTESTSETGESQLTVDFANEIAPELEIKCLECHNSKKSAQNGGLNLETRELALTTGNHAPTIIPGSGKTSYFVQVLRLGHHDTRSMPPTPDKILDDDVKEIITWIDEGAHWPDDLKLRRPDEW